MLSIDHPRRSNLGCALGIGTINRHVNARRFER